MLFIAAIILMGILSTPAVAAPIPEIVPYAIPDKNAVLLDSELSIVTDRFLFELDWSDDGCSNSPDNPLDFDFMPSCQRHDFGYRNYKKQGRFDEANRKKLDDNFLADLKIMCELEAGFRLMNCIKIAKTYHKMVRNFGHVDTDKTMKKVNDEAGKHLNNAADGAAEKVEKILNVGKDLVTVA
ncbi:Similar to hypothetical protein AATC3_15739 [Amycolatopsis sp. ATCC 39116]; acc. no. ZP_10051306 [Pyronema omphalodes CBS 100304]|uniref:Uncharacterized protein n=1 Tax=Pyronema omphalodes (strain CBS 100304) TaxID=1076935 RepID=U4LRR1_PYROM|nr:Similar to hypothetical protein AATC3_15739 [Amycolatopsis sp. ATCC 39116]; acc. no. ZP_10051306 [Pyronema omphalodes CBS 100304]